MPRLCLSVSVCISVSLCLDACCVWCIYVCVREREREVVENKWIVLYTFPGYHNGCQNTLESVI